MALKPWSVGALKQKKKKKKLKNKQTGAKLKDLASDNLLQPVRIW